MPVIDPLTIKPSRAQVGAGGDCAMLDRPVEDKRPQETKVVLLIYTCYKLVMKQLPQEESATQEPRLMIIWWLGQAQAYGAGKPEQLLLSIGL